MPKQKSTLSHKSSATTSVRKKSSAKKTDATMISANSADDYFSADSSEEKVVAPKNTWLELRQYEAQVYQAESAQEAAFFDESKSMENHELSQEDQILWEACMNEDLPFKELRKLILGDAQYQSTSTADTSALVRSNNAAKLALAKTNNLLIPKVVVVAASNLPTCIEEGRHSRVLELISSARKRKNKPSKITAKNDESYNNARSELSTSASSSTSTNRARFAFAAVNTSTEAPSTHANDAGKNSSSPGKKK